MKHLDTNKFYIVPSPVIKGKAGKEVHFPVSYRYNGGIVIEDKWYEGYAVGDPIVPHGLKLKGIGVGLQLNARPPYATAKLIKE